MSLASENSHIRISYSFQQEHTEGTTVFGNVKPESSHYNNRIQSEYVFIIPTTTGQLVKENTKFNN